MTATIETLHKDGNEIYPTTVADAVVDEDNHTVQQRIDSGAYFLDGGTASVRQLIDKDGEEVYPVVDPTQLHFSGTEKQVVKGDGSIGVPQYVKQLEGNGRIASADIPHQYDNDQVHQRLDISSSSMTTGKPLGDGFINTYSWDNTGSFDAQVYIPNGDNINKGMPQIRFKNNAANWSSWKSILVKEALLDFVYPVGAIYMSVNNVSPQTFLGGTWVSWGAGKVPVGVNTSETEFNAVEKTGGQKNHRHDFKIGFTQYYGAFVGDDLNNQGAYKFSTNSYPSTTISDGNITISRNNVSTNMTQNYSERIRSSIGDTDLGSSLQPYITCYMWKRTA